MRMSSSGDMSDYQKSHIEEGRWRVDRCESLLLNGAKGHALINSAGVAGMLAFMQAMITKAPQLASFKSYGIVAASTYMLGAFMASVVFFCMLKAIFSGIQEPPSKTNWMAWSIAGLKLS